MIYKQPPSWLAHHGIEGQRWGVKHGPPYPLDSETSTGNKLKTKDTGTAAAIAAVAAIYAIPITVAVTKIAMDEHEKKKYNNAHDEFRKNYKTYESHFGESAKQISEGDPEAIAKYKKEGDPLVVTKKDLRKINAYGMENPKGNQEKVDNSIRYVDSKSNLAYTTVYYSLKRASYGRSNNCTNCATAFVLNKLGWQLNAAPVFDHGRTSKEILDQNTAMFKGYTREKCMTSSDFKSILNSKADGTFGSFDFNYRTAASGHILNWAKEDGKVYIYDAQNATRMSLNKFINKYNPDFGGASYVHDMTGSEIDWDKVAEYKYTY